MAHLFLVLVNLIYAVSYGFSKDVLADCLPPFTFILCRVFGAFTLFWICFFKTETIQKKHIVRFMICGALGVAMNQLMFFEGLANTSSINASIIMVTTPILVLMLSFLFLNERLSSRKIIGVLIGLFGALGVILWQTPTNSPHQSTMYGNAFIFMNACSYAGYLVCVKPLMKTYKPFTVLKWVFTFGTIYVLPFGLAQIGQVNLDVVDGWMIFEIGFVVFFTTFLTYLLSISALNKVSPTLVSMYIYIQPVLTIFIAVAQQKEQFSWFQFAMGLLVCFGVYLVANIKRKKA